MIFYKLIENFSKQIGILIPIIKEKELNFKFFVKGFHEYRKIWESRSNEILEVKMEPTNKVGNFAVAVIRIKKLLETFLLDKLGPFQNNFFFLKCEYSDCKVKIVMAKLLI